MTTIYEETSWIRKLKPGYTGTYGIEIETESIEPYALISKGIEGDTHVYNFEGKDELKFWKIVEDHSLRNYGYEYILTKPLDFAEVDRALNEFEQKTDALKIDFIEDKQSTSVHVHVNMRDETFLTLGNFVTLFTLFENPLINFCGERRKGNFFCMSNRHAEGLCRRVTEFFIAVSKGDELAIKNLSEEDQKYSSLNLVPLNKLGSVEIRTMRGVTDVAVISNWVGMLNSLLLFARQEITPLDIIAGWRQGEMEFFESVFGQYSDMLRYPEAREEIERSLWYAGSIAAAVPDWNKIVGAMLEAGRLRDEKKLAAKVKMPMPKNIIPGGLVDWNNLDQFVAHPPAQPIDNEEVQF